MLARTHQVNPIKEPKKSYPSESYKKLVHYEQHVFKYQFYKYLTTKNNVKKYGKKKLAFPIKILKDYTVHQG